MGLISKEVEVNLVGSNIPYYEKIGYTITRKKDCNGELVVPLGLKIIVKTKDLPPYSHYKVSVQCDKCGTFYETKYANYCRFNHEGKIYCNKCAHIVFSSGKNHYKWDNNKTNDEREHRRLYPEYTQFIKSVLARDNYTCQCCGKKSESDMEVHHLYGYAGFPEHRINQKQALSLCKNCHQSFHSWHTGKYGFKNKGNCTRGHYEEWIGNSILNLEEYNGVLPSAKRVYCYELDMVFNSISDAGKKLKINPSNIYRVCNHQGNTAYDNHWFWYDEYIKMKQEDIDYYISFSPEHHHRHNEKVICLNTKEILPKLDFCKKYNITPNKISNVISNKSDVLNLNGIPILFMYYSDYLSKSQDEINEIIVNKLERGVRPVICLNDGRIFYSMKDTYKTLQITHKDVLTQCESTPYSNPEFKYQLMYYKNFLILSQQEQNNLLDYERRKKCG